MALTQFVNEQAILDLVASDFAYKPNSQIAVGVDMLQSFPDNSAEYERGFPPSLVSALNNAPFARTHRQFIASGLSVVEFDNWIVENKFDDPGDGFGAVVLRSRFADPITNKFDYIVAFRGTDGLNAQDWYANLDLAKEEWARQGVRVVPYLLGTAQGQNLDQTTLGHIHFTGHSLGGGLAQYAAYAYAQQRKVIVGRFNSEGISLITFNAFGGVRGLQQLNNGVYDPTLLAGVETAHFVIDNDIVHRLGAGDASQLASVGGSWHVNGKDNTYRFDFLQKQDVEFVRDSSGRILKLNMVAAHRTEAGFYAGFDNFQTSLFDFTRANRFAIDYLDTPKSQSIGAAFSRVFNKGLTTEGSATARLIVGLVSIGITGERAEIRRFGRTLLDVHYASVDVPLWKKAVLETIAFPDVIRAASVLAAPAAVRELVLATGVEVLGGLSGPDKALIWDGINSFLPSDKRLTRKDLALANGIGEREKGLMYGLAAVALSSSLDPGDIDEIFDDPRQREAAKTLVGVTIDADALLNAFSSGADWLRETLSYLQASAAQSGRSGQALVEFDLPLIDLLSSEKTRLGQEDAAFQDMVATATKNFLREDFGWALANTNADFRKPFQLAHASVFGATQFDFINYDRIHDALVEASNDPRFSAIRSLIEEALQPIELAGETVVVSAEHPVSIPFDTPGFDPDLAPLPSEQVREGGIERFTLSLPYGAGEGGQRIAITLDGPAASQVKLLADGEEVVPQGSVYTVTVPRGERELELSLWGALGITEPGLTEPNALSVSATLVDAAGEPTHQTHTEANAEFAVRGDFDLQEPVPGVFGDGNDVLLIQTPLSGAHLDGAGGNDVFWGDTGPDRFLGGAGDDRLFGSFRVYFGANDQDWLSGGMGSDQLLGGEGDDIVEGDAGSDIVLGDVGDDFLFAGSQADYATLFTVGGLDPTGDLVQGGAGDDLVVGSAGNDNLSGGNDADLILGGGGNDEIRGDTEFVPTHFFHIIGSTFPPQQPLAGGADVLYGNAGNDALLGEAGADRLYGGEGGDTLIGGEGQDELFGGAGDDFLVGDADSLDSLVHTADFLHGGEGNDYLRGQGGSDTLIGDAGEDRLDGGEEADLYVFNRGDGVDTIFDDGSNTIRFGPGIDAEDLELGLGSLYIRIGDSADAIRIENFNPDDVLSSYAIDSFEFFNGERLSYAQLIARGFDLAGTEEDDAISGTNVTDRISGGGGNDMLDGRAGADTLSGGLGDDVYVVDEPGDVIHEAQDEGNDTVESSAVSYVLGPDLENLVLTQKEHRPDDDDESDEREEGGQVVITGGIAGTGNVLDNQIFGNVLDNVLDGGAGNDFLAGDFGSDTYRFGRGSGADTISEFDDTAGNLDSIQLAADVAPAEVAISRESDHLVLSIRNSADRVTLLDWFLGDAEKIEQASFADGTAWDVATLEALAEGQNSAPVVSVPLADQTAQENAAFAFTIPADTFSDPGNTLAIAAARADGTPLPGWLSFDAATQGFSGIAANNDVGTLDIAVTATDAGGLSASDTFTLTVANINDAPVLAAPIADQGVLEDAAFSFTLPQGTFADVDADDMLSLGAALADESPLPAWLAFDPLSGAFNGTPTNDDVGALNVRVTATDAVGAAASDEFALEVANVNDVPSLTVPLADQFANQNAPFVFAVPQGVFTDVDTGDSLALSAALAEGGALPGWLGFDPVTGTFSGTPSEFDVGNVNFRVTAIDNSGDSASDLFTLSVSDASTVNETHVGTRRGDVIVTGFANDLIDAGRGDDLVHAGAGRDIVFGGRGEDRLYGEAGNDRLYGGKDQDQLYGGLGVDLLYGGRGDDLLDGGVGDDLLAGGAGHDRIATGEGRNIVIGGAGHDMITGGPGREVFLVNFDDGKDQLHLSGAAFEGNQDVLSLGGGIGANDISLKRDRGDLIVEARGADERASVVLKDWYRDGGDHQTVTTLQLFEGGTAVTYDFKALVARFDAETQDRHPTHRWSAVQALPAVQLTSGAEPLGGDIAWEYAITSTVLGDESLADEDAEERAALPGGDWDPLPASNNAHPLGSNSKHDSDRGEHHSKGKLESLADLLEAYLGQKPHYDFEALAQELERSERRGEALDAQDIARRWRAVGQYASALAIEHDEDARGGADYRFNDLSLLGGGAFGGGFGYSGSTGTLRRVANLQTLQGLDEGLRRLNP